MEEYYENKITWAQVVTITKAECNNTNGLTVIKRLFTLDYNASILSFDDDMTDGSSVDQADDAEKGNTASTKVHPLDVMNSIYNCSDPILLQILMEKLFVCRMSLPQVFPDKRKNESKFLLWSLRSIVPEWKSDDGTLNQQSLVEAKYPILSFLRIGHLERSKSKLLNYLLSPLQHVTFFHRDCKHGMLERTDSNGTIESSWYLPTQNKSAKFKNIFSVWNLRGNAASFPKETGLLFQVSALVVLMMSTSSFFRKEYENFINKYIVPSCQVLISLVCLPSDLQNKHDMQRLNTEIEDCRQIVKSCKAEVVGFVLDWRDKKVLNDENWKARHELHLCKFLSIHKSTSTLTDFASSAQKLGFRIDQDDLCCKEILDSAKTLLDSIKKIPFTERKIKLLPLQGNLLKEYSDLKKRLHREKKSVALEEFIVKNKIDQQKVRQKQYAAFYHGSQWCDFIRQFIILLNNIEINKIEYLVVWTKHILDEWCRQPLRDLHAEYHKLWNEIQTNGEGDIQKLRKLEHQLSDSSFGMEHILREFGQICESVLLRGFQSKVEKKQFIDTLPNLVAHLLLKGIPFELMNGDTASVPVEWVNAVFQEVIKIIGDKKIFVVSVVGIQSSGKSTLLNTLFGLQFAVSAGRCTRGVFCQLIPIDKETTELKFDYMLVIDTEGLRAPELQEASKFRDNELATFVIGIGDVTLVNIKGEIASDIQDVLQIVTHAMLRIKLVEKSVQLKPSCILIHQNVSDVSADEKMRFGQEQFQSNLDRWTVTAAEQEMVKNVTRFDQVIQFNKRKHICYIPDLWQGERPMATVNLAYSEQVEKIKELLISDIASRSEFTTLSRFVTKVADLWNAVLHENFVFSFKNSEEVKAFLNLDMFISNISWELKNECLKLYNSAVNEILSQEKDLETVEHQLTATIASTLANKNASLEKQLLDYFEKNESKDIIEQWRSRSIDKLSNLCEDESKITVNNVRKYVHRRNLRLQNLETAKEYTSKVHLQAKRTADELRTQSKTLTEEELDNHFNTIWTQMTSDLKRIEDESDSKASILKQIHMDLEQKFTAHSGIFEEVLKATPLNELTDCDFETLVDVREGDLSYFQDDFETNQKRSNKHGNKLRIAREQCSTILHQISEYVTSLNGSDFLTQQSTHVVETLNKYFKCIESDKKNGFSFHHEFIIRFTVYTCKCAAKAFVLLRQNFRNATDPMLEILDKKPILLKLFKNIYFEKSNETRAADMLSSMMITWTRDSVLRDMGFTIANFVITQDFSFQTKQTFLRRVLKDMCLKKDFQEYISYIRSGETFLRQKVSKYKALLLDEVDGSKKNKLESIIGEEVGKYMTCIMTILNDVEDIAFVNQQEYFDKLGSDLRAKMVCPSNDIQTVSNMSAIADFKSFTTLVKSMKTNIEKEIVMSISKYEFKNSGYDVFDPDELLAAKVLGCSECCPFCGAQCCCTEAGHYSNSSRSEKRAAGCENTAKDDEYCHRAIQHQPIGMSGIKDKASGTLILTNCQTAVDSDIIYNWFKSDVQYTYPYKEYKNFYPDWYIAPDRSVNTSMYWKWAMATFNVELAKHYEAVKADIPSSWNEITQEQAIKSLDI